MSAGVYAIEHIATGRQYIGSTCDFNARWRGHRHLLRKGKHHAPHLQSAWNKYGEGAFSFAPLLICSNDNLLLYEQRCLDVLRPYDRERGFNVSTNAKSCRLGRPHTAETKARMSALKKGMKHSAETKARWSAQRKGRKMPAWFGETVRARMLGTKQSPELLARLSIIRRGVKPTLASVESKSKLTMAQATEIRTLFATGRYKQCTLAQLYGVHQSHVSRLVHGKYWPADRK